ncbi:hypothetical protein K435DRAFT_758374 [Dendrothele bispora CBS 962.96]|uniref:Uncharacterized protein n=1 Tax=Dendrothele bispora (strain CBS 962.96) TaxID=1314807 RepID=A0A4S8LRQ8_DENBC|nr:hypothetical protein K435DRAFT_758374 [Dendrothele bispora CBS 962.96]
MVVVSELARQARLTFSATPDAPSLPELTAIVDDLVSSLSPADAEEVSLQIEHELQTILDDVVDHSCLYHSEILLTILYHLRAIITPLSIISSWFDLLLRPAMREPKLATHAVNYAKELILSALHADNEQYSDKVNNFLRLLFDLYLLDALNEGSNEDILEWASLDQVQKEKKSCWKANLEDILLRFGEIKPGDLMTELFDRFSNPSYRLQLTIFINLYVSNSAFESSAATLANHPLMTGILHSALLDNSTTCCTIGLTVLTKLLPILAVHAPEELKGFVPLLFAILARISCWKQEHLYHGTGMEDEDEETPTDADDSVVLEIRSDLIWQPLGATSLKSSPIASLHSYFTFLYYLFPLNLLKFLRDPVYYLSNHDLPSPYTVGWDSVLYQNELRNRIEPLLQQHLYHSVMAWTDDVEELAQPFWIGYDVPRIVTSAVLLDARNATLAFDSRNQDDSIILSAQPADNVRAAGFPKISLQDMVTTSILLKSRRDIDSQNPHRPSELFSSSASQPETPEDTVFLSEDEDASQALSILQRDVLLLRNELNFELWLSRANIRHIGRLWQNKVLSQSAEVERQGLYNKLRNYRTQVVRLESELREHKEQASSAKHKYADWNTELQKKLGDLRKEKKDWQSETAKLRATAKEAEAKFLAQEKLLAEAHQEVFKLETQRKENQHKIDHLRDYEKQIEQYFKMQCLWDDEFAKFNERGEEIERIKSLWKQMEQRLGSFQMEQERLEDAARGYRRQIQKLQSQLSQAVRLNERRVDPALDLEIFAKGKDALIQSNKKLQEANADLLDENEELRAMVEVLRNQVSGKQGLV